MTFIPNSKIQDSEILYRVIRPWNRFWKKRYSKISTAAFKDKDGLSVDRDGEREELAIIEDFRNRKYDGAIISLSAKTCREINTYLIEKPTINIYHAEIHDSPTQILISDDKCELLMKNTIIVTESL